MIKISNLEKTFDKGSVKAVRKINFEINDNEIFALLGPNGAGKTTTMRMLSTLIYPTNGTIEYDGISTVGNEKRIRSKIGFLTNEIRLDGQFTPNELAYYYGSLYGLDKRTIDNNKNKLFKYLGVSSFADRKYESFSTGMKQKTSIAICLIHNPDIIIFDEPTNGLDVLTQKLIEDYILQLKKEGKTIIISTHILEVVERLSDRVGVIIDGRSVYCGPCDQLASSQNAADMREAFISLYQKHHSESERVDVVKKKRLLMRK